MYPNAVIFNQQSINALVFCAWQTYLFFSLCNCLFKIVHPCVYTQNANACEVLSKSQIVYIWQPYLFFHIYEHLHTHISFFSFMPITSEIVHAWVSIYNVNAYEVFK